MGEVRFQEGEVDGRGGSRGGGWDSGEFVGETGVFEDPCREKVGW